MQREENIGAREVLGHDHISDDDKLVAALHLF
jgi:hypothetical protein